MLKSVTLGLVRRDLSLAELARIFYLKTSLHTLLPTPLSSSAFAYFTGISRAPILTWVWRLPQTQSTCPRTFIPLPLILSTPPPLIYLLGHTGPRFYPNWGSLLGWIGTGVRVHIFIFVRLCDLHFTLLLDLFRQVKANELLMNKSVKYSPLSQLPIQMLLIS